MQKLSQTLIHNLVEEAKQARLCSYSPYSGFQVGAALLAEDGTIFRGCNIENASYGATICAERNAFFQAVQKGCRKFTAIAIVGGKKGEPIREFAFPCGICRQVMQEFCDGDFRVIAAREPDEIRCFTLSELLPYGFGGEALE